MNILSREHSESSPHVHDYRLRLNSHDFILVRINLTSPEPKVAIWLDSSGSISPCPLDWKLLCQLIGEAIILELKQKNQVP